MIDLNKYLVENKGARRLLFGIYGSTIFYSIITCICFFIGVFSGNWTYLSKSLDYVLLSTTMGIVATWIVLGKAKNYDE